ncbi:MAG: type III-B CRISPR module-associated Cmr3 family protein [Scytonema sp. PMC 1069.18]|nr:type III-B CRISPR module-associated Cmr3 family protein [Scytonema sp. PMC 1069.18]MEC4881075.1 type III-B CRISPR module-associated Cmr3 family protein [Scytonema sp. PMC 1070.18]
MQLYGIEALDIMLFREAKPFSPTEGSWAKGIFPPLPTTVFQALRSAIDVNETDNNTRQFQFIGPFLLYEEPGTEPVLWLPTPKDLLCVKRFGEEAQESSENNDSEESTRWQRLVRLQPLDRNNEVWKPLGFDPDYFPENGLSPMVKPPYSPDKAVGNGLDELGSEEYISDRPHPWIKASALIKYLQGENLTNPEDFHPNPWSLQVLPHIQMAQDKRQVKSEDGYFTEVAVRLHKYWKLVAGINATLKQSTVRLGGEGHRALVYPLHRPPVWDEIQLFREPSPTSNQAYLLTPGLAQVDPTAMVYGVYSHTWRQNLSGCVSDRPILWGGKSVFPKTPMLPQRAFVPPGTVYWFKHKSEDLGDSCKDSLQKVLPQDGGKWLQTLQSLNYGTLLWNRQQ